jgi:hypothetical protein
MLLLTIPNKFEQEEVKIPFNNNQGEWFYIQEVYFLQSLIEICCFQELQNDNPPAFPVVTGTFVVLESTI